MTGWIILGVSLLGFAFSWKLIYKYAYDEIDDTVFAVMIATIFSFAWPVILLGFIMWYVLTEQWSHAKKN